jgi:hypothetical protein
MTRMRSVNFNIPVCLSAFGKKRQLLEGELTAVVVAGS